MTVLADRFLKMNNRVIIAAADSLLPFFRSELPGVTCISFPGFKPRYSGVFPQYLVLFLQIPMLLYHSVREHFMLRKIIHDFCVDIVISDNRFGLWNKSVKTVYVTHQIRIPFPKFLRVFEFIGIFLHREIIRKYSYCFIPDLPGEINISGRLSHGLRLPLNTMYTGLLSRFAGLGTHEKTKIPDNDYTVLILSGPEPLKTLFENKLTSIFKDKDEALVILEGRPGTGSGISSTGKIIKYGHLPSHEMRDILKGSRSIITRGGYSTIMELITLGCSALLIPTPGQTEQEYLSDYLSAKGWFTTIVQNRFDRFTEIPANIQTLPDIINESKILLEKALDEVLKD